MPEAGRPWEQQAGESENAFAQFKIYRDIGPERTLLKAWCIFRNIPFSDDVSLSGQFKLNARRWEWKRRAGEWDRHRESLEIVSNAHAIAITMTPEQVHAAVSDEVDWIDKRRQIRRNQLEISELILTKVREMATQSTIRKRVRRETTPDGRTINYTIWEPAKWSFRTMAEMAEIGIRLARLGADMPIREAKDSDDDGTGGDGNSIWVESSGQLESVLPPGAVPPMPEDPTIAPHIDTGNEAALQGITLPERLRPDPVVTRRRP